MKLKRNLIRLLFVIITILLLLKLNWTIKQNADLTVELDVLTIIRYIFASIESNVIFVVLYIVSIVVINKVYKIKYDENDLKKYEGYHRDIIAKYTPGILTYIDEFKVDESTVVAIIMNLERKNIINCDNTIQIISSNLEGLSSNELYVLDAIQNNNLKYIEYGKLEQYIVEDCFKLNLLEENDNKESFQNSNLKINVNRNSNVNSPRIRLRIVAYIYIFFVVAFFTFCILAANFGHNIQMNFNIEDIALVIAILGIIVTIYRMVKISTQAFMMKNGRKLVPYIRTKEAKEINENLEGLKNYIKDFSTLKEKDKEALTLWNEYLIYSVMFGQNTKIIEEYKAKF